MFSLGLSGLQAQPQVTKSSRRIFEPTMASVLDSQAFQSDLENPPQDRAGKIGER
jgi:hypothetical protein